LEKVEEFTIAVFGECGQGKSTLLSKISEIYSKKYLDSIDILNFTASKSLVAVTSHVRVAKRGHMTLIDSPGTNDPNKTRTDKQIFLDLINTIREPLKSSDQGITMFIQCIMPDESDRIRQSVIKTMTRIMLILSIFHKETSVEDLQKCHPIMAVVYNHVSRNANYELTL
jgi:pantothenate kinase-related protein Tda10